MTQISGYPPIRTCNQAPQSHIVHSEKRTDFETITTEGETSWHSQAYHVDYQFKKEISFPQRILKGPREGNGSPLQCSCLENPMDGGPWWAAVLGVKQSQTRLKRLSSSSSSRNLQEKNLLDAIQNYVTCKESQKYDKY